MIAQVTEKVREVIRVNASLLRLTARIDLHEESGGALLLFHFRSHSLGNLDPVDGLNDIEKGHRLCRLVALQGADEVQLKAREFRAQGRPFLLHLLHPVFAKDPVPASSTGRMWSPS